MDEKKLEMVFEFWWLDANVDRIISLTPDEQDALIAHHWRGLLEHYQEFDEGWKMTEREAELRKLAGAMDALKAELWESLGPCRKFLLWIISLFSSNRKTEIAS